MSKPEKADVGIASGISVRAALPSTSTFLTVDLGTFVSKCYVFLDTNAGCYFKIGTTVSTSNAYLDDTVIVPIESASPFSIVAVSAPASDMSTLSINIVGK